MKIVSSISSGPKPDWQDGTSIPAWAGRGGRGGAVGMREEGRRREAGRGGRTGRDGAWEREGERESYVWCLACRLGVGGWGREGRRVWAGVCLTNM